MSTKIERRIVEERCPGTGTRKVRMERITEQGQMNLNGHPVVKVSSRYLDGTETVVLTAGDETVHMGTWEAVPARTNDVLDFGRLEGAAATLTREMAAFGPQNPPTADQVVAWLNSWQHLQTWRKEALARMTAADGQIDVVGTLLRQFL